MNEDDQHQDGEEDYYDEEEEDEADDECFQSQALPVDSNTWSDEELAALIASGEPPSSAAEYIARVRYESNQLPAVVTASAGFISHNTKAMTNTKVSHMYICVSSSVLSWNLFVPFHFLS